jgi:hypothetical protein
MGRQIKFRLLRIGRDTKWRVVWTGSSKTMDEGETGQTSRIDTANKPPAAPPETGQGSPPQPAKPLR